MRYTPWYNTLAPGNLEDPDIACVAGIPIAGAATTTSSTSTSGPSESGSDHPERKRTAQWVDRYTSDSPPGKCERSDPSILRVQQSNQQVSEIGAAAVQQQQQRGRGRGRGRPRSRARVVRGGRGLGNRSRGRGGGCRGGPETTRSSPHKGWCRDTSCYIQRSYPR